MSLTCGNTVRSALTAKRSERGRKCELVSNPLIFSLAGARGTKEYRANANHD